MEFKIGDRVKNENSSHGTVCEVPGYSLALPGHYRVRLDCNGGYGLYSPSELTLLESNTLDGSKITAEQNDAREVNNIIRAIDEYIFYDGNVERGVIAKPGLAISVLIQILVSNGTLTYDQVKRALVNKDQQEGK